MPLQSFLSKFKDESEKVTYVIGFTKEGWKLPINSICLVQDHIGNEIHANLQDVFEKRHDFEDVKMKFRELYEKTGIAHKDQLFQWAIFSPFLYAYREIGGIMPALVLQGPAQTGKSRFLEMILKNWYGHLKEVQNGDSIGSSSRLESIIAGSTLPIIIDDCTNAHEWIVDVLKSYLTLESNFLRKGAGVGGQFATVNKPLCAPLAISCNEPPNWFSDDAFLERVYLEIIDMCEQKEGWNEIRDQIPRGSILQILYEMSKLWDLTTLKSIVKSIKIPAEIKDDSRKKYVYCAFAMGQKILKEIFGIDTKLDQIIHVLNRTRSTNMDSLRALIDYQIENGKYRLSKSGADDNFAKMVPKHEFYPKTWIRHPICDCRFEDNLGIKREAISFNINNLRDLQSQFEGNNTKKWTLQTFLIKIQKQFPNAKIGKFYNDCYDEKGDLDNKIVRCVAIPKSDICRI